MNTQNTANSDTQIGQNLTNTKRAIWKKWAILLGIIILGIIIGVVKITTNGSKQANITSSPSITQIPTPSHDYPGSMILTPANSQIKVGESAVVKVIINASSRSLDGADSIIRYDPTLFDASIVETKAFPSYVRKKIDTKKGVIAITGVTFEPKPTPVSSDLVFAQIAFKAKKVGLGKLTIEYQKRNKSLSTIIESGTSDTLLGNIGDASIAVLP